MKDIVVSTYQGLIPPHLLDLRRSTRGLQIQPTIFPDRHITPKEPSVEVWKNNQTEISESKTPLRERLKQIIPEDKHYLLLEGTGFNVLYQIENIKREFEESPDCNLDQIHSSIVLKCGEDLHAFWSEFLMQSPVLLYHLAKADGKIVAPNYGNVELASLSLENEQTRNEREGATWEGVIEFARKILIAKPGEIVVLTSPAGWAADGGWKHPETQTYVAMVLPDGSIDAVTFRSDMSLDESKELMAKFGVSFDKTPKTEKEEIKMVVKTPATVQGRSLENILNEIKKITGRNEILPGKSYESALHLLKNRGHLEIKNPLVEEKIEEIRLYVQKHLTNSNDQTLTNLALFLGRKALELSFSQRVNEKHILLTRRKSVRTEIPRTMTDDMYRQEAHLVRQKKGCVISQEGVLGKVFQVLGYSNQKEVKGWKNDGKGICVDCKMYKTTLGPCGICLTCEKKYD